MAVYVLIHGGNISKDTWNSLAGNNEYPPGGHLGNKCWKGTVTALKMKGHDVFAPNLKDENSSSLTEHIDDVCTLINGNGLRNV